MFVIFALLVFVLKMFGVQFGSVDMLALGLALICLHLLIGRWPFEPINTIRTNRT